MCCTPQGQEPTCCKVEAVVSIDERGQMVLPKELRDRAGITAGDKLAIISWGKAGKVCCISMIQAESFSEIIQGYLGPLFKDLVKQ